MIHVLHDKINELIKSILVKFVSPIALENTDVHKVNIGKDNQLPDGRLDLGRNCAELLSGFEVATCTRNAFLNDVREFYSTLVKKLIKYFSLE